MASIPVGLAPAVGEDLEAARDPLGIDGDDNALSAELLRRLGHERRVVNGGGVDRDLVGARQQQRADILDGAHPAAHGERHEADFGGTGDDVVDGVALLVGSGDIQEAKLVRSLLVIDPGLLYRVSGIHQIDEVHALDHAPGVNIEARDDAHLQHGAEPGAARSGGEQRQRLRRVDAAVIESAAADHTADTVRLVWLERFEVGVGGGRRRTR